MRILSFTMLIAASLHAAVPVWIDTDPSVARGGHEVDDGFALLQAFQSKELQVRGVSVVFGNASLDQGYSIAQHLVKQFGPAGLGVYNGAAKASEFGTETDASRALSAALAKERLTILLLGPATNVATVLRNQPDLSHNIERIIAVAGRRPGQRFLTGKAARPFRDFNFEMDAEAFAQLLRSKVPLVLAPWEVSSHVSLTSADLGRLRAAGGGREELADAAEDWLKIWKTNFGVDGFNPFDTLAVGYATSPALYTCEVLPVEIREMDDDAGTGKPKPYLLAARNIASEFSATYCSEPKPAFKQELMDRLAPDSLWTKARAWFLSLGQNYGVNPFIFGTIYVGAIPFFGVSLGWLIRSMRNKQPIVPPLLTTGFFFVSAYLYLIVAGKNIPIWVYLFIAGMVALGVFSTIKKIRKAVAQ